MGISGNERAGLLPTCSFTMSVKAAGALDECPRPPSDRERLVDPPTTSCSRRLTEV